MKSSRFNLRARSRLGAAGVLAAALFCANIAPAQAVPAFSLAPSATTVAKNQAFTVNVLASDVTDLYGYQFNVSFDPSLYRVVSVTEGSFLGASGAAFYSPGTIDNAAGTVSFVFETLVGDLAGVSGSGLLTTIGLSALGSAVGAGSIGLNEVIALNSALDTIALGPVASAVVNVVPEPAVWAMLALGLVVVGRRRPRSSGAVPG